MYVCIYIYICVCRLYVFTIFQKLMFKGCRLKLCHCFYPQSSGPDRGPGMAVRLITSSTDGNSPAEKKY